MSLQESRYVIYESLSGMNRVQTEQVMNYIRQIMKEESQEERNQELRRRALEEINIALNQENLA